MQALLLFTALFLPRRVEDALAARLVGPWGAETAARRDLKRTQALVLPRGADAVAPGEGVRADILGAA